MRKMVEEASEYRRRPNRPLSGLRRGSGEVLADMLFLPAHIRFVWPGGALAGRANFARRSGASGSTQG